MTRIQPESFGPLCDAYLHSIKWIEGGRDVVLFFELGDRTKRAFTFDWIDCLNISIQQGERTAGCLLTWEGTAERLPNGRTRIALDFAHQGSISFECNEITVDK